MFVCFLKYNQMCVAFQVRKSVYLTENADKSNNHERNLIPFFLLSSAKEIDQMTNFRYAVRCLHPEFIIDQRNTMKVAGRYSKDKSFPELQTRNFKI